MAVPFRTPPETGLRIGRGAGAAGGSASKRTDGEAVGKKDSDWGYSWIPVVGPIVGGAIAGVVASLVF